MAIKNIFSKLKASEEKPVEFFLALEISTEIVKSAVWAVEEGKTSVLKVGSIEEWDENDKVSLIRAVDKSISLASEGLAKEPQKVIFGLPETWVKGSEIREKKKQILGLLVKKLALKPIGFVVILEALTTYLKEKEGTPVSAIFVHLSEVQATVSLVKLGQIKGSERVGRSEDLAADVREGLARFKEADDLPSRIILFNGVADFEEAKQQLISFDWPNELPFLHFPKVEVLPVSLPVKAVAIAGGSEAAKALGFTIKEQLSKTEEEKLTPKKIKKEQKPVEEKPELVKTKEQSKAAEFGFIQGKDITAINKEKDEQVLSKPITAVTTASAVANYKEKKPIRLTIFKIKKIIKHFCLKIPHLPRKKSLFLIIGLIIFFILIIGAGAFYWYVPRAQIILYLKPQVLEKELEIIVDPEKTAINEEKNIIPGTFTSIEVEGNKKIETSGEKLVGDKAKGEIVIYNKTDLEKTFSSGTVLIGPDKLTFILKDEVKVASRSAEEEGVTYGKATALVTAASIGADYNLDKGIQLSFKDYPKSLYSAKVNSGLSGGTSRQVKAVASEDLAILLEQLKKELVKKAEKELVNKISPEKEVLKKEAAIEILEKKYSREKGEEGEDLSLDLKLKLEFIVYNREDFEKILISSINNSIPDNFIYLKEKGEINVTGVKIKDKKAKINVLFKAKLVPQIDKEQVKKDLKGRYPQVSQEYLKNVPNFVEAEIKITPSLPAKLNTLPRKIDNMKIEVKIKEK